ncbi:MAG: hypothetical protein AAGE88_16295 [Actinomycetota bacterium]
MSDNDMIGRHLRLSTTPDQHRRPFLTPTRRRILGIVGLLACAALVGVGATAEAGRRTKVTETAEGSCSATADRLSDAQKAFGEVCAGLRQVDCDSGIDGWTCSDQQITTYVLDGDAEGAVGMVVSFPDSDDPGAAVATPSADQPAQPASSVGPPTPSGSAGADADADADTDSDTGDGDGSDPAATSAGASSDGADPDSADVDPGAATGGEYGAEGPATGAPTPADLPTPQAPSSAVGTPGPGATSPAPSGNSTRNAIDHPFAWDSPWNLPLGTGARYLPAGIEPPGWGPGVDEDILFLDPTAPLAPIVRTSIGWGSTTTRCDGRVVGTYQFGGDRLPVTPGFTTEGDYLNNTPNHAGAWIEPDGRTIRQSQPVHVCTDGTIVTKYDYPDDDIYAGDGIPGAHGGSGMSSLGGTIRLYDLEQGRIDHALKLTIQASQWLSKSQGGYRWPALRADAYVNAPSTESCYYGGTNPSVRMGALLALPADFDVAGLETELGRMMAQAMRDYGGYVVDDVCWDKFMVATEWGPQGRVTDAVEDRWGISMHNREKPTCSSSTPDCRYARDIAAMVEALQVIDNNAPSTPGGPGTRIAPCAPPFTNGTGAPPAGSVCDGAG